MSSALEIR